MNMFENIKPLYREVHAYIRHKLSLRYPGKFSSSGPIPAHIFGYDSWLHQWNNIKPYPNADKEDLTAIMKAQHWTVVRMFASAEEFFTSIGMFPMTPKFWINSMFKKPEGRIAVCHATAFDMNSNNDFR